MPDIIQKRFIIGDEWLYFKLYSGPKTLESILINEIQSIVNELFMLNVIDKFFYIHYSDPDYHLRIRFHLPDISKSLTIILVLNQRLKRYINNKIIWKFSTDTYNRELERYGSKTITEIESLFNLDTLTIINFLKETDEDGNDKIRWLWGVKCIDLFLEKFGLLLNDKATFYSNLNDGFSKEFNLNTPMRKQLDKKFRYEMSQISQVINSKKESNIRGIVHIMWYMKNAEPIIYNILKIEKKGELEMPLYNLLGSLVHMHFNRLFRTKQRMHEMIIYYFMHKFYKSQIAMLKNRQAEIVD